MTVEMNQAGLRNMTEKERAEHEIQMGCPSMNIKRTKEEEFQFWVDRLNTYKPVITEQDRKSINKKKWWQLWK